LLVAILGAGCFDFEGLSASGLDLADADAAAVDAASATDLRDPSVVAWWSFDDKEALGHDGSGNGNTGQTVGTVRWASGRRGGGALELEGTGWMAVQASPSLESLDSAGTVALWVALRAGTADGAFLGRRLGTGGDDLWTIGYDTDTEFYACANTTSSLPHCLLTGGPAPSLAYGVFVHLALVIDAGQMRLYRDGVATGTRDVPTPLPDEVAPLVIGAGDNGIQGIQERATALIDDVRIWNRALSAEEIATLAAP
jgi:hypothetical protein